MDDDQLTFAKAIFTKMYHFNKNHIFILNSLAIIHRCKEEYSQSLHFLNKSIRVHPLHDETQWEQSLNQVESGNQDKAVQKLKACLDVSEHYINALEEIAQIYFKNKNYSQSISYYLKCSSQDRLKEYWQIRISDCYWELKDLGQYLHFKYIGLSLCLGNTAASQEQYKKLANQFYKQKQYWQCLNCCTQVLKENICDLKIINIKINSQLQE